MSFHRLPKWRCPYQERDLAHPPRADHVPQMVRELYDSDELSALEAVERRIDERFRAVLTPTEARVIGHAFPGHIVARPLPKTTA